MTDWIRLLRLGDESWLGIVAGRLTVGDATGPKRAVDPAHPIGLLPLLERPYSVVALELKERETALALAPGAVTGLLSLDDIPRTAVECRSGYWVDLALEWLESMPPEDVDGALLDTVEQATWATQRARHRARRLARQAETRPP